MFDLTNFTMNTREAEGVSKLIFIAVITGGKLADFHEIETGIEHDTQIPFIGNLGMVGKALTGCTRTVNGTDIPVTEKVWTPKLIGDRLMHCAADINPLFKIFKRAQKVNPDFFDRIATEEFGVIVAKVQLAMEQMLNRLVWFGDTAADNVTNSGSITDGVDPAFFTPINGLWKQIIADVAPGSDQHINIAANEGVTKAAQDTLADGYGLTLFRQMFNAMDARFFEIVQMGGQPKFLVTRALMQNYWDKLEDASLAFTLQETKEGTSKWSYRGIPIVVRNDWDSNIRANFDNGTVWELPHRALLTTAENIPVGTVSEEDLTALRSWYEMKDTANYVDFDLKLDTKHLLPHLTVAAY